MKQVTVPGMPLASYLHLNELYMYSLKFPKYYGNVNITSICTLLAHSRDMHVQWKLEGFDYESLCMHDNASGSSVECSPFYMQKLFVWLWPHTSWEFKNPTLLFVSWKCMYFSWIPGRKDVHAMKSSQNFCSYLNLGAWVGGQTRWEYGRGALKL